MLSPSIDQEEIVKCLLDHGATTSIHPANNFSPLQCAIEVGKLNIVRILVRHGVDLSFVAEGTTPVAYARETGHEDIVTFLLEQGAI